jgi:hypothetical protein
MAGFGIMKRSFDFQYLPLMSNDLLSEVFGNLVFQLLPDLFTHFVSERDFD